MKESENNITIITAISLPKDVIAPLVEELENKLKLSNPTVTLQVDATLIGGVKLIINSVEYDSTVIGKLEKLRTQIKESL